MKMAANEIDEDQKTRDKREKENQSQKEEATEKEEGRDELERVKERTEGIEQGRTS